MAFGITDAGFSLKRLNDILADMKTSLSSVTDPKTGESLTPNLLDENDPMVLVINAFCDGLANAWEQLQLAYNQFDPLKATGAGLSGLVQLNGLIRKVGYPTTVVLTLTGTALKSIDAGKQVTDINNTVIFTLPAFTFNSGGSASVVGTATVNGSYNLAINAVTKIVTPTSGLISVTNLVPSIPGADDETDEDLRSRQQNSTVTGAATIESIYAALMQLTGVTFARIYQNVTNATDSRGITAKSIAAVIIGGNDNDIGNTLYGHIPAGCLTFGSTTYNITDIFGNIIPMNYIRPTAVPIYIAVAITVYQTGWPISNVDTIKALILDYCQYGASGIGITTGYEQLGYVPGQSVFSSDLYTPINQITGFQITSLYVGIAASPTTTSVTIAWDHIATFNLANINITVS